VWEVINIPTIKFNRQNANGGVWERRREKKKKRYDIYMI
jgi:hypothetical protein